MGLERNGELGKKFARVGRRGITGLMASTAIGTGIGAAVLGFGQATASASPGIAPLPTAPAMSTYLTDRLAAFADQYARSRWSDYQGGITPSEPTDFDMQGGGTGVYVNPSNKAERIAVYCPNTGPCSGMWASP